VIAPEVSKAIDRPGGVKNTSNTINCIKEKGRSQRFSPEIPRDERGDNEIEYDDKWQRKPMRMNQKQNYRLFNMNNILMLFT